MKVKLDILEKEPEEHNMIGRTNMKYKLRLSYKNKSYTFDWHDSVSNYETGIPLNKNEVLDMMADNFRYWNYTVSDIISEFGDMDIIKAKAIIKEAENLKRLFENEETILQLKSYANKEDYETKPDNEEQAIKNFNDDHTIESMQELKGLGIKDEIIDIRLIHKHYKDDKFLLGETKEGDRVYIERGSFDCGWYYGFGYLETFSSGAWSSHTHFSGLNEGKNINLRDALINYFIGGGLTITSKQTWILCELMKSFYTLHEASELYYRGGSHFTTNTALKKNKSMVKTIDKDTRKVIREVQKLLSPNDEARPDYIKDEPNYE